MLDKCSASEQLFSSSLEVFLNQHSDILNANLFKLIGSF